VAAWNRGHFSYKAIRVLLGYNTNGFAHHRLADALEIIAEIGYRTVAITLERTELDPPDGRGVQRCVERLRPSVDRTGLQVCIETGARFILDPRRKHQPTLLSGDRAARRTRVEFLKAAIDAAAEVGAKVVSLWSGTPDDAAPLTILEDRLAESLGEVLGHADRRSVDLAFEPEPGMYVQRMADFEQLQRRVAHPRFGLTLDVGHLHCLQDGSVAKHVQRWRDVLWNVHLEDMRAGVHKHLMFGDGEMDFAGVFAALRGIDYPGLVNVELSRHSHDAVKTAKKAFEFLSRFCENPVGDRGCRVSKS